MAQPKHSLKFTTKRFFEMMCLCLCLFTVKIKYFFTEINGARFATNAEIFVEKENSNNVSAQ